MRSAHRWIAIVSLLAVSLLGSSAVAVPALPDVFPVPVEGRFSLDRGASAFWLGEPVPPGSGPGLVSGGSNFFGPYNRRPQFPLCGSAARFPCWDYELDVADGGGRLRVAVDSPTPSTFGLELYGPDGSFLASHAHIRSSEVFADDPEPGRYRVRVIPYMTQGTTFRMRAKLERNDRGGHGKRRLLPNLRSWFDKNILFGGCEAEDPTQSPPPGRCIRFGVYTENTGEGILDLRMTPLASGETEPRYRQRIYAADGSYTEHEAGTHTLLPDALNGHLHFHVEDIQTYELFRVTGAGSLEPVTRARKQGWCMEDAKLADWERFYQAQVDDDQFLGYDGRDNNCGFDQTSPVIALTAGWGDLYAITTPGQFVHLGDAGDGEYLIRATADIDDLLIESNEHDNVGYTHIRVSGDAISILERGYGSSPWDPQRVVLGDWEN